MPNRLPNVGVSVDVPTEQTVLESFALSRLLDLTRLFGCEIHEPGMSKERLVGRLGRHLQGTLPALLGELSRDELRLACRRHGLDDSSKSRAELSALLLVRAGLDPKASVHPLSHDHAGLPREGQVLAARHRQWLITKVLPGAAGESPLLQLVCLDDDDPGRELEILWDLELGAQIIQPESVGLGGVGRLDPPEHFGAYLHALKWSAVSAADATRFQAPFRAGIKLMAHQLTPLMKALELPRANLFIADDVGLGKTIEAGLVLQELLLRQQVTFSLVVCPASLCLQWQGEMQRRFGLRFEIMTREFVARRRKERGFGANPWSTHNRFIVSHSLVRRPEYRDGLLTHLRERGRKGLLILDEAHAAAPASASRYATDTEITATVRDLAPHFDHRLFLSATPHNGHSNSFSALLEILDPARFTRGVPVDGPKELAPIMVRRLKRDLRQLGVERFPRRMLVELSLTNQDDQWTLSEGRYDAETGEMGERVTKPLAQGKPTELLLAEKLARYTELCAPVSGQGRLPFIHLQQRLLSSPEAFARSIEAHAQGLLKKGGPVAAPLQTKLALEADPEAYGLSDEATAEEDIARVAAVSASLPSPTEEARQLLSEMRALAEQARRRPDAKTMALFAWLREHLCPALGLGENTKAERAWKPRRVILFTEYADTKRYLFELLKEAARDTAGGEERVLQFHGGMGDESRDEVQRAFNSAPEANPVRILVATDAAREGVNLQGHCADLFHIDIPWNPSRLEQRNGRIDRTLQPADEVRCHYFVYPDRVEDQILQTVLRKITVVQRELGSLGAVLFDQIEGELENGLSAKVKGKIDAIAEDGKSQTVAQEFEGKQRDLDQVKLEVERAGKRMEASKKLLEVAPESLRGVIEIGLSMAGAKALAPAGQTSDGRPTFTLPVLDRSWDPTLDTLRPPRGRDEPFWQWRQKPPKAVTFHPLVTLSEDAEQLHLAHPFVKRILDRFLAQGFGAHDLSRVTAVIAPDEHVARCVAYARLTLFGQGATRLHDQLVPVAAAWSNEGEGIAPYKDPVTAAKAVATAERLVASAAKPPNAKILKRIGAEAANLFSQLWPHLEAEADALGAEAKKGLAERARKEADDLRKLLTRQKTAIDKAQQRLRQAELFEIKDKEQKRQVDKDLEHLEQRRRAADLELEHEPRAIEALYEVKMTRLTPVGMIVTWPEAMT